MKKLVITFIILIIIATTAGILINKYNNRIKNFNEITTIEDGKKRIEFVLNKWKSDFKDVLSGNGTMERNKLFFSALKTSQNCGKNYINLDNDQQEILTEFAVNIIKSDRDIIKFLKSNNLELLPTFLGEYEGVKSSHTLYNKYGEEVIINGNYVTIPASTYTLNLKYNNSIELKITNSDSNYFYQGKYEIKEEYKTNIVKDSTGKVVENSKSYIDFRFTLNDPGKEELSGHFDYNKNSKEIDLWFGGELVNLNKITAQNKIKIKNDSAEKLKISEGEALNFMRDRCDNINQTLMKRKTINDLGVKKYYFLSVARNGEACISIINENKLEILSADCGESYSIINKWNNIN